MHGLKFYAKLKMVDKMGSTEIHWVEVPEETHDKLAHILNERIVSKRVI